MFENNLDWWYSVMHRNELKDLSNKLKEKNWNPNNPQQFKCISESIDFLSLIQKFSEMDNQDAPDGIVLLNDTVYVIEHFRVSYFEDKKHNGEGSGADLFQKARKRRSKRMRSCPETITPLSFDLQYFEQSFAERLEKHMNCYEKYRKNAEAKFPGKMYKLILVLEDNSDVILDDAGHSILDFKEISRQLQAYPEIDGVICFTLNSRGVQVDARDRLEFDSNILTGIVANPLMYPTEVVALLTDDQKEELLPKIRYLIGEKGTFSDIISMEDGVCVEKKP